MKFLRSTVFSICRKTAWLIAVSLPAIVSAADSERALVAVASNFTGAARALQSAFEQDSGHAVILTFGSTGQLYAQIRQGAPFDVFLAADQLRPQLLEESGDIVPGSRFTYAIGALTLAAKGATGELADAVERLRSGDYSRLAMANPQLAPYGRAARQVLVNVDGLASAEDRLVLGENVGQVFAMLSTGNVELAFIARAQLAGAVNKLSVWSVPAQLHEPISQDLVLLHRAIANPAAQAFHRFLSSDQALEIIARHGYRVAID